ncbi:hypothetical protein JNB88_32680 [Rhizobium cauense]|uniref:hypothetical protein n=1 Tax=Rhizobium cauense TaxID=1166683 RepID=UPI001C6E7C6B|nr:hypothetical protein [Rhizobium cauense]MBW9118359.1 hypothetical protein [Rhizobium cauense]
MVETLVNDIQRAQASLPQLTPARRHALIERILDELRTYRRKTLGGEPAERCLAIDRLIASVSFGLMEIVALKDAEFCIILVEFQKLISTLEEIAPTGGRGKYH